MGVVTTLSTGPLGIVEAVPGIVPIPGASIRQPGAALGARGAAPGHHAIGAGPALLANTGLAW